MNPALQKHAAAEPALVRVGISLPWLPGRSPRQVDLVVGVQVPVPLPSDAPSIGLYRIGDLVQRHRAYRGTRMGPPPVRADLGNRLRGTSYAHARLFKLKDFSDLRFDHRPATTDQARTGPTWIVVDEDPVGDGTGEFDLSGLGRIVEAVRAAARKKLLPTAEDGWLVPRPAPRWILQWGHEGWKASLSLAEGATDRNYRVDRLDDALRLCSVLGRGHPPRVDGEVIEHDPAWTPAEHNLVALARKTAPHVARDRCFDPLGMPAEVVKAWRTVLDGASLVEEGGPEGAVSVLRSFMLISDHVALTRPDELKGMFGPGYLRLRLETDGIEMPESVVGCPNP